MIRKKENNEPDGVNEGLNNSPVYTHVTNQDYSYDIRAAVCTIEDRDAFLHNIRNIAEAHDTHIICFNADMLAGMRHAHAAIFHGVRSYNRDEMVSNTLEMEALLYAAGSRQCSLAAPFGVHVGANNLYVCCYPLYDGVWDALSPFIKIIEDSWSCIDSQKQEYLMDLFGITQEELTTTRRDCIVDLVLERIALLEVYR